MVNIERLNIIITTKMDWLKSPSKHCHVLIIFAEWVVFAYWLNCIRMGLRLQPAQQDCFEISNIL